jgi:hypothetical protein
VFQIRDPDKVLDFVTRGIVHGLDQAAPTKAITVKEGLLPLYLWPNTLVLMAKRDSLGRSPRYKAARNKVTAMVRRDKEMMSLSKLSESGNSPTFLWEIANAAVGKPRQPLPALVKKADGTDTEGNLKAANVVNAYYPARKAGQGGISQSNQDRAGDDAGRGAGGQQDQAGRHCGFEEGQEGGALPGNNGEAREAPALPKALQGRGVQRDPLQ